MLKARDVALIMNCSRAAAYELMHLLGPVRFGERAIRLPEEKLRVYIDRQCRGSGVVREFGTPIVTSLTNKESATVANDQHGSETTAQRKVSEQPKQRAARSKLPFRLAKAVERARRPSDRPMPHDKKHSA